MSPRRQLASERYTVLVPEETCAPCLKERMAQMDDFVLRSRASERTRVGPSPANPFLRAWETAAAEHRGERAIAADRQSLVTPQPFVPVCLEHCAARTATGGPPRATPAPGPYRASLDGLFASSPTAVDLANPVAGPLSADVDVDVTSPVTAKVSGFIIRYTTHGSHIRPWGGHTARYDAAQRIGLLEGIERLGATAPAPENIVRTPPDGIRRVGLDAFGVPPSGWLTEEPEVLSWTPGVSLSNGERLVVPTRMAFYAADVPDAPFVQESSNGCAVGGTDAEAQLYGLLEAIERDAFLIAWYGGIPLQEIDPGSLPPRSTERDLLLRMGLSGQRVRCFDATVGVPVPTVIAISEGPGGSTCVGAGAHPDPARALRSALVEVASDFPVVRAHLLQREPELARMLDDFDLVRSMEDHADMFGHPRARPLLAHWLDQRSSEPVPLTSLRRHPDGGRAVPSDLALVLDEVRQAGMEAVAVPAATTLTRQLGVACWRVLVPGLIPIDFGWARQRALHMPRLAERARHRRGARSQELRLHMVPHPFP